MPAFVCIMRESMQDLWYFYSRSATLAAQSSDPVNLVDMVIRVSGGSCINFKGIDQTS